MITISILETAEGIFENICAGYCGLILFLGFSSSSIDTFSNITYFVIIISATGFFLLSVFIKYALNTTRSSI